MYCIGIFRIRVNRGLDYMLFILVVKIVIVLKEVCVFDEEFLVILIKN